MLYTVSKIYENVSERSGNPAIRLLARMNFLDVILCYICYFMLNMLHCEKIIFDLIFEVLRKDVQCRFLDSIKTLLEAIQNWS